MKKLFAILLVISMLLVLAACGGPSNDIKFINKTGTVIHNLYISHVSSETWGDPISSGVIDDGRVQIYTCPEGETPFFDIGVINEDALNTDAENVEILPGYELTLGPSDGERAILTVKDTDGNITEYECICYYD